MTHVTVGALVFVLIGAAVAILRFTLRDGKGSSRKKKEKPESTVI